MAASFRDAGGHARATRRGQTGREAGEEGWAERSRGPAPGL
ncbi:hypothetical protein [Actinomycetospora sp. NBRC 106378]|nr:hypothetical protein [Actinomycetospora sp. NBRC 106378]